MGDQSWKSGGDLNSFTFYYCTVCSFSHNRQSSKLVFHFNRFLVPASPLISFKVKDVRLPQNLQRAMAAEAEASREARAKVKSSFLWIEVWLYINNWLAIFIATLGFCWGKREKQKIFCRFLSTFFMQVIAAEGEQKASKALKEASDIISESPAALQLR